MISRKLPSWVWTRSQVQLGGQSPSFEQPLPAHDPQTFFNLAYHLHQATSSDAAPTVALIHKGQPAAAGYADLLALDWRRRTSSSNARSSPAAASATTLASAASASCARAERVVTDPRDLKTSWRGYLR